MLALSDRHDHKIAGSMSRMRAATCARSPENTENKKATEIARTPHSYRCGVPRASERFLRDTTQA